MKKLTNNSITLRYILTSSSACGICVHTTSYICDSMSKRYCGKGIVSSTYMSFIGVRLSIKGRILFFFGSKKKN